MIDWAPLLLTLKLALATTSLLLIIAIPVAAWLAQARNRGKPFIEALINLPLVLPPTVLGFYLLLAFQPGGTFGAWLDKWLGLRLVFSFEGLVLASAIYSLPFMIQPIQSALQGFPPSLIDAARVMGKSKFTILFRVMLPNIKPALLSGIILSIAHTFGEFGVVLMIGGSIPGETRVAAIAIYEYVEALEYRAANTYSILLLGSSFLMLLLVYLYRNYQATKIKTI